MIELSYFILGMFVWALIQEEFLISQNGDNNGG